MKDNDSEDMIFFELLIYCAKHGWYAYHQQQDMVIYGVIGSMTCTTVVCSNDIRKKYVEIETNIWVEKESLGQIGTSHEKRV